ncbi:expressed unknown protein [Seminavis robusta]|uniref:Uncharacterized protein n=1 Tax=Seminavis robusta TaxID=568900 RepID=A0A9N8H3T8_9STRA|nr:expressed unknown protein [Seminavis robusta]|eukprot:Sro96_g049560.1 n/a (311) ;mRNA; r:48198-49130
MKLKIEHDTTKSAAAADRPDHETAWRPLAILGRRMFHQKEPAQQVESEECALGTGQKKATSDQKHAAARIQNEIALGPLPSVWDSVEKYMDGDSVFNMANTCSTANDLFRESESFTRPCLPYILGHQARAPKIYYAIDPNKPRWLQKIGKRKMVQVKHSFLVLLMQSSPEVDGGDYHKVQLHFIFDYPATDTMKLLYEQVRIDGYRYSTTEEARPGWTKVPVAPKFPVTTLMKEALTTCFDKMRRSPPSSFPFRQQEDARDLMGAMETHCRGILDLDAFQKRKMQRAERQLELLRLMQRDDFPFHHVAVH